MAKNQNLISSISPQSKSAHDTLKTLSFANQNSVFRTLQQERKPLHKTEPVSAVDLAKSG
jgi:hypothetical protein